VSILAEFNITKVKEAADILASEAFPGEGMIMYVESRCALPIPVA
jgi:hypothetical protein